MSNFAPAPEVAKMARSIIAEVESHKLLRGMTIEYLFTDQPLKEGTEDVPFKLSIGGKEWAYLATREHQPLPQLAVILCQRESWNLLKDRPEVLRAYLDRTLLQIGIDEKGKLCKNPFDVQEFAEIVHRHGAYNSGLKDFLKQAKNPLLPFEKDEKPKTTTAKKGNGATTEGKPRIAQKGKPAPATNA